MSTRDRGPFEVAHEEAEARREALDDLREDVAALVRDEVARSGVSRSTLDAWIREVVREEAGGPSPAWTRPPVVVAATVALLALGAAGHAVWSGARQPTTSVTGPEPIVEQPVGDAARAAVAQEPPPLDPVQRYDSLFAARSALFGPLLTELRGEGVAAAVREAAAAFEGGDSIDAAATSRLRDALLQLALRGRTGEALALDGVVRRTPCGGSSCGALVRVWQEEAEALGLPPFAGGDPAEVDPASLLLAEAAVVLAALEGAS